MPLRITAVSTVTIPRVKITQDQVRQAGGVAIQEMFARVRDKHLNVSDAPMPSYSSRGPIYVPVTGKGRTKTSLKGREVLTAGDIRKARGRGAIVVGGRSRVQVTPFGIATGLTAGRTRRSLKFRNYADYKRFLGKSGLRDLELSGRMLGALTIVRVEPKAVEIGWTREEEHRKALGNQRRSPWFGLSPANIRALTAQVERMVGESLSRSLQGRRRKP